LLWRLKLEGVDTGNRFERLAQSWERAATDTIYAFNDLHAVMAFIGADRMGDAGRTISAMRSEAARDGDNAAMTRHVGLPLAEAFVDFASGRHRDCVEKILKVRPIAQRFGGSHAQRDIITLTALHAALKAGMRDTARALAFERTRHKPESPWARNLFGKAEALKSA
jgi:hypothetical protein